MSESNNPWKMVVIGCGVLAVIGCCCCIGFAGFIGTKVAGPIQTTSTFFAALATGNADVAYDQMAPDFQAAHPKANFLTELASLPGVGPGASFSLNGANTVNGTTTVTGTINTPTGAQPVSLEVVSVGGLDKIRSITVGSTTLR